MTSPSARGLARDALDTPALLVDLDLMDSNIARLSAACRANKINWRPHTKGQKIPELAHRQIAAGAIGVTCAKLGEAEVMANAGIRDILIANQIVGATKVARLIELARRSDVIVAIDNIDNLAMISSAASMQGVHVRVVIELDVGMKRAGVEPGQPAVVLARAAIDSSGIRFAGLMAWEGHASSIENQVEKRLAINHAVSLLTDTAELCRSRGIPVPIVSCGGTGTFAITATLPGVTEIQAGGGVFADVLSQRVFRQDFTQALTVLTTVTSRPTPLRIVCDAGKKSMSSDAALPEPIGLDGVQTVRLAAEHAILELSAPSGTPLVGDKVEFVVGYGDTTVHLHEELYGVRGGKVEVVWPIVGRGKNR